MWQIGFKCPNSIIQAHYAQRPPVDCFNIVYRDQMVDLAQQGWFDPDQFFAINVSIIVLISFLNTDHKDLV